MFMSLHHRLTKLLEEKTLKRFFNPETASGIRRLQFFWVICLCFVALGISYLIVIFLFEKSPIQKHSETLKPTPKTIETASHKVDLNEVWRHKVEDENKKLYVELKALKELFHEGLKDQQNAQDSDAIRDLEARLLRMEDQLETLGNKSEGQKQPFLSQGQFSSNDPQNFGASLNGEEQAGKIIHKFSLGLSENPELKQLKTVETTIPAGAFAKTVLLSGLDASASMTASSDPRPMLLRVIDPGTLPRRFQSDLKDCHCTASAFGDLSSERIYARLEKLTCIERKTGEIIETQVAGYIAGADGKAGIRGIVASKDGQFLGRSLVGGVFAGLSNVANPQNRQSQVNPFFPGSAQVSPPGIGQMFTSGMAAGASSALDRLSQYYIDRAEQLQPVIQVAAGQVVDIVFTEGTFIGSQNVKSEIEKTRLKARLPTSDSSTEQGKENL
jgi:conjugal transfer pilus assembly protein TraB